MFSGLAERKKEHEQTSSSRASAPALQKNRWGIFKRGWDNYALLSSASSRPSLRTRSSLGPTRRTRWRPIVLEFSLEAVQRGIERFPLLSQRVQFTTGLLQGSAALGGRAFQAGHLLAQLAVLRVVQVQELLARRVRAGAVVLTVGCRRPVAHIGLHRHAGDWEKRRAFQQSGDKLVTMLQEWLQINGKEAGEENRDRREKRRSHESKISSPPNCWSYYDFTQFFRDSDWLSSPELRDNSLRLQCLIDGVLRS